MLLEVSQLVDVSVITQIRFNTGCDAFLQWQHMLPATQRRMVKSQIDVTFCIPLDYNVTSVHPIF